jgi:hypothetical protein
VGFSAVVLVGGFAGDFFAFVALVYLSPIVLGAGALGLFLVLRGERIRRNTWERVDDPWAYDAELDGPQQDERRA